jgi:hypothetical protein
MCVVIWALMQETGVLALPDTAFARGPRNPISWAQGQDSEIGFLALQNEAFAQAVEW